VRQEDVKDRFVRLTQVVDRDAQKLGLQQADEQYDIARQMVLGLGASGVKARDIPATRKEKAGDSSDAETATDADADAQAEAQRESEKPKTLADWVPEFLNSTPNRLVVMR